MRHRRRLVILASLLLTAAAPPAMSGCVEDDSFGTGPSCRAGGEWCLGDSSCCSGVCMSDNLMGPGGNCLSPCPTADGRCPRPDR